jgi:hypothetical protein
MFSEQDRYDTINGGVPAGFSSNAADLIRIATTGGG